MRSRYKIRDADRAITHPLDQMMPHPFGQVVPALDFAASAAEDQSAELIAQTVGLFRILLVAETILSLFAAGLGPTMMPSPDRRGGWSAVTITPGSRLTEWRGTTASSRTVTGRLVLLVLRCLKSPSLASSRLNKVLHFEPRLVIIPEFISAKCSPTGGPR